jgi:uncharacterized protein YndB with AHSA1/START domain
MLYNYNVLSNPESKIMSRNYTVSTKIARPVSDVFDAIVSADHLNRYFTTRTSGDLEEGAEISWFWEHWGSNPVRVSKIVPNTLIELSIDSVEWQKSKDDSYQVRIIFEFKQLEDGMTMLSISEQGWKTDADGLKGSHENCGGWAQFTKSLKAYLEHDIDLR